MAKTVGLVFKPVKKNKKKVEEEINENEVPENEKETEKENN